MNLKNFIYKLFGRSKKPMRVYIKDVKPGQQIIIEWDKMEDKHGWVKCINNDPKKRKIWLRVKWGNYSEFNQQQEYENLILRYWDRKLKNFILLNYHLKNKKNEFDNECNIAQLQQKLNDALETENYELAEKLQQRINKLMIK